MSVAKPAPNANTAANLICSIYKAANMNDPYQGLVTNCAVINITAQLYVYDTRFTDAASFTSAMSGVKLVYELATPIVYDLTDEQIDAITTFLGDNTLWADTGAISLTYRADPTKYIDKRLAELSNN